MSTLEAFTVHRFGDSALVAGTVVIDSTPSGSDTPRRSVEPCAAAFGWPTDQTGLRALMTMIEAAPGFTVPYVAAAGTIACDGVSGPFTAVRARPVVDWAQGMPVASLLLDFVAAAPHSDVDPQQAYATLQVTLDPAKWAEAREVLARALHDT